MKSLTLPETWLLIVGVIFLRENVRNKLAICGEPIRLERGKSPLQETSMVFLEINMWINLTELLSFM